MFFEVFWNLILFYYLWKRYTMSLLYYKFGSVYAYIIVNKGMHNKVLCKNLLKFSEEKWSILKPSPIIVTVLRP